MFESLDVTDSSGHTEAAFEGEAIRVSFRKTSPEERGLIDRLIEKAKAGQMTLHTVDKDGETKLIEDATLLEQLFKSKNELLLKGSAEAVKKIALELVEMEIDKKRLVLVSDESGEWKIVREKEELKPKEEKKEKVQSHEVPRSG